jgi:rhodanese-related sulfurtransferase
MSDNTPRISAEAAHQHMVSDGDALLVCAYDDRQKFEQNHLAGAIALDELEARVDSLPRDRQLIFYCA